MSILFASSKVHAEVPYTLTNLTVNFIAQNGMVHPQVNIELQRTSGNTDAHSLVLSLTRTQPSHASVASSTFAWTSTAATFTQGFTDTEVTTGATVGYELRITGAHPILQTTSSVRVPGPPDKPQNFRAERTYYDEVEECIGVDLIWDTLSGGAVDSEVITGYDVEVFSNGVRWWIISPAERAANITRHSLPQGNHWRSVAPAPMGVAGEYPHCFQILRQGQSGSDIIFVEEFSYRIRARNQWTDSPNNLLSPWSDVLVVPGEDAAAVAEPPQNLSVALSPLGNYILTWEKPSNASLVGAILVAYDVYQLTPGMDAVKIDTDSSDLRTTVVYRSTLMAGVAYSWYVIGVRAGMKPAKPSAIVTAGTPTAPTVHATGGAGGVLLEWHPGADNGNGDNEIQWRVTYQSTASGNQPRHPLPPFGDRRTRGRFVDIGVAGTYLFAVQAVNRWGEGAIGQATATVTTPATLSAPTQSGTATVTVDDTTFTLTGPNEVQPGTEAFYTINGGEFDDMLGVATGSLKLVNLPAHSDGSYDECSTYFPNVGIEYVACILLPYQANTFQRFGIPFLLRYRPASSEPFADGASLRVRIAEGAAWVGEQVAVGFRPERTGQGTTVSWLGAAGAAAESRRIIVRIMPTESPRPPNAVELSVTGTNAYRVAWVGPGNAAAAGIERYEVYRQTGDAPVELQESVLADRFWSEFAQPDPTLIYRWYVESVSFTGARSAPSREVVAGLPNASTDLRAAGRYRAIALSWSTPEPVPTVTVIGYRVERSANGIDDWSTVVESAMPTVTEYVDDQLRGEQTFHYRVSTRREGGYGPPSNLDHATTLGPATNATPTAPRNLSPTATRSSVSLNWDPPIDDGDLPITGYAIRWSRDGTTWQDLVASTGSTTTSHVHSEMDYVAVAHYQLAAINSAGAGYFTPTAAVTKPTDTLTPPMSVVTEPGFESLTLRWSAAEITGPATVQGYRVEYYDTINTTWVVLAASAGRTAPLSFTDSDAAHPLQPAQERRYRIHTVTDRVNAVSDWIEFSARTRALSANLDTTPGVGTADALILYYALALATEFDPGQTAHASKLRNTFLQPLVYPVGDADSTGLEPVLEQVRMLTKYGLGNLGNMNHTPRVDADDALILYYASGFQDLLGDGQQGGSSHFREALLTAPSGLETPNDADLRDVLGRARTFLRDHR